MAVAGAVLATQHWSGRWLVTDGSDSEQTRVLARGRRPLRPDDALGERKDTMTAVGIDGLREIVFTKHRSCEFVTYYPADDHVLDLPFSLSCTHDTLTDQREIKSNIQTSLDTKPNIQWDRDTWAIPRHEASTFQRRTPATTTIHTNHPAETVTAVRRTRPLASET